MLESQSQHFRHGPRASSDIVVAVVAVVVVPDVGVEVTLGVVGGDI